MRTLRNIFIAGIVAVLSSCSFLDLEPNIITGETYYNNETELLYGLAGIYGVMNNQEFYGNYYSLMLSGTDDLTYCNRYNLTANYTLAYRHDASSSEIYDVWVEIYQGIRNANAYMEAIEDSDIEGAPSYFNEARFLRAFYHFILAQGWGDIPLKDHATRTPEDVNCAATPQLQVLQWVASEMEACIPGAAETLDNSPSRVTKTTMEGILARVYLFMAGESVSGNESFRKDYFKAAMDHAKNVIDSGKHRLNPSYSQIFINMISDVYDTEYRESMWEVDFKGNRSSSENWTNGRIGDMNGLQSTGEDYEKNNCNYSYAYYNGSYKLWQLYIQKDRTDDELYENSKVINDVRQDWNLPPYNYSGNESASTKYPPYGSDGSKTYCEAGIDKTPYTANSTSTYSDPTVAPAIRNCGKFRREVIYEGRADAKRLYTQINYPILRYSDVLLMYAEAFNEYNGFPTEELFNNTVLPVRNRAGIKTRSYSEYSTQDAFRQLVRNERGRELCFESLRKYDLIRWGIFVDSMHEYSNWADQTLGNITILNFAAGVGNSVQQKHTVYPIPSIELGVNKLLVQNPLW